MRKQTVITSVMIMIFLSNSNAFSETITITCPTLKGQITNNNDYPITHDGYDWLKEINQKDNRFIFTLTDKNYVAVNPIFKHGTIELRCRGGQGQMQYSLYTEISEVTACKVDNTHQAFVCETTGKK